MRRGVRFLLTFGLCAGLLSGAGGVTPGPVAATVPPKTLGYSAATPLAAERWNALLTVPKFDARLGTLRSVTVRLTGRVTGSARFEHLAAGPFHITQMLSTLLELRRPGGGTLIQTLPLARTSDVVGGYDGATDFSGGSGRTHAALAAETTRELQLTGADDLALFTGAGPLALRVLSRPKSGSLAEGEFTQSLTTDSSASLTVLYAFEALPVAVQPVSWSALKLLRP